MLENLHRPNISHYFFSVSPFCDRLLLGLVAQRASVLVLPGLAGGLLLALAVNGVLEGLLFGVEPQSPIVLAGVTGGLLFTATIAAYVPATRAASVDPASVLREE